MNKIVSKTQFSEKVFRLEVEAPLIAKARKAGHFVIVRVGEKGERIPMISTAWFMSTLTRMRKYDTALIRIFCTKFRNGPQQNPSRTA